MSQRSITVKASGDLVGDLAARFKQELAIAFEEAVEEVVVDLARPSIINGPAGAALLMARNTADVSGKQLKVKLGHTDWQGFERLLGLEAVVVN